MAKNKGTASPGPPPTLRERAESKLDATRADVAGMSTEAVQSLVHELQVHQIELELQNEELRAAQLELSRIRDRYSDLYEFAPVGYLSLSADGVIRQANRTAARMLDRERSSLIGHRLSEFVASESQDALYLRLREGLATGFRTTFDVGMKRSGGGGFEARLELLSHMLDATTEEPSGQEEIRVTISDISARKVTERALEASEERYRRLAHAVIDYIFTVRIERGGPVETIHGINCEAVTGYTPEELAANDQLWMTMIPPEDRGSVEQHVRAVLAGGSPPPLEHRIRRKDGNVRWVLRVSSPEHDEQGRVIAYDGLLRDITEEKRAEDTLRKLNIELGESLAHRESQLEYSVEQLGLLNRAVTHLAEGVLITDDELDWPGPRIVFVNEAMCRITGYAVEELIGESPRIFQGEKTDAATSARMKKELAAGRPSLVEVINHRKDGTPYHAEVFITPMLDEEGRRTNFVSIHRDISERKETEGALHRDHELAEAIITTAPNIVLVLDTHGRVVRFNHYMEQLTGWTLEEVQGRDWFETFLPERYRQDVRELFGQALSGQRTRGYVNPILTRDGAERHVEWFDAPLTDAEGRLIGLLATGQDITERRKQEEAVRRSEERLNAILDTATDAIITIDRQGIIGSVNPAVERLFGYTPEELVGRNVSMLMPSPFGEEHDGYLARYRETGEARIIGIGREVIGRAKDGSLLPLDLGVSDIEDLGIFTGILRDISDRKQLQREVLTIAEEEQRRIGQDLHDSVAGQLVGLRHLAESLAEQLRREGADGAALEDTVHRLAARCEAALGDTQAIARGLVPPVLGAGPEGLMEALRRLAEDTDGMQDVTCAFKCDPPVKIEDVETATQLYRIAQEAVANALKHGWPETILIELSAGDGQVVLTVFDDGIGIDPATVSKGVGLKTLAYRAGLIGAQCRVEEAEGGGTRIACHIPRGVSADD